MYLAHGAYDRISLDNSGITTYRLFIKKHYGWDNVSRITCKQGWFGGNVNSLVITIYIKRIEKKLAFDIIRCLSKESRNYLSFSDKRWCIDEQETYE